MFDITAIKNYILYLKKCGLDITLHPSKYDKLIYPSGLISFNIHDNPYCIYLKTCPAALHHCISKQPKVIEKSKLGAYTGVCCAGVKERIYPIKDGDEICGFVAVSGYKTENSVSYIEAVSNKFGLNIDKLRSTYNSLKNTVPDEKELDTLITPLLAMLELGYEKVCTVPEAEQNLFKNIERYIRKNHNQEINEKLLCERFGCSASNLSHNFKKHTGLSLRDYVNDLRLSDAKKLLKYSDLDVTEIAIATGFNDSNYFSSVFKKFVGCSPSVYRNSL